MAAVNYIDSLLASAPYRIIGSPSNNPTPVGVTVTPVSGGAARDITITWSYTQGVIPASSFGIVWVPSSSAPTKTDNFIAVPLGQTSYTFKGIDPATTYRIGILALQEDILGDVVSPTVTPNWIVAAGVTNYSGLVSGITAANVASAVSSIVDDGIISVIEKVGLRVYWNTILGEKSGINAQATAYSITTENTTYNTKFQLLANFLNGGTWSTGYPLYINDTNKDVETNIGETERGTFLTVSKDFELAKSALLTKIAEISGTKSTWTGTTGPGKPADNATVGAVWGTNLTNIPSTVFNLDNSSSMGVNGAFYAWSGTYPDGWMLWSGSAPIKEFPISRGNGNGVRFNSVSGGHVGITINAAYQAATSDFVLSGSYDVYLVSRTAGLPCIHIHSYTGGTASGVWIRTNASNASIGVWQTVPFTLRIPAGTNSVQIYLMASWADGVNDFTGSCIFANLQFSLQQSSDFYNKAQQASDIQGQLNAATQVLDSSLTATKTAIAAINPASGNLSATQIATIKGFFSELAALSANLGTVTAGTLDTVGYGRFNGAVSTGSYTAALVANNSQVRQIGLDTYGTYAGINSTGVGNGHGGQFTSNGSGWGLAVGANGSGYGAYISSNTGNALFATSSSGYAAYFNGNIYITGNIASFLDADTVGGYYPSSFSFSGHTHSNYCSTITTDSGYTASCSSNTFYFASAVGGYQFQGFNGNGVKLISVSDPKLKQDIESETLGSEFIKALNPVTFRWKKDPLLRHHGFLAPDFHPLISGPFTDALKQVHDDGTLGADYMSLIAPIVKTLQEILTRLETLENQNGNI